VGFGFLPIKWLQESIDKLLKELSAEQIGQTITDLSQLYTRFYTSTTGVEGSRIAAHEHAPPHTHTPTRTPHARTHFSHHRTVNLVLTGRGTAGAKLLHSKYSEFARNQSHISVHFFEHTWPQPSVIARIEGTGTRPPSSAHSDVATVRSHARVARVPFFPRRRRERSRTGDPGRSRGLSGLFHDRPLAWR
jgi:hypothetical protein